MEQFGRVPSRMIFEGRIAGLKGSSAKVYLVLAAHVDLDWLTFPGVERISKLAGIDQSTARRGLHELIDRGLIEKTEPGGGRNKKTVYRMIANPDDTTTVSRSETQASGNAKRGQYTTENPGDAVHKNRYPTEKSNRHAAAGLHAQPRPQTKEPDPAIIDALKELGIGGPKRQELGLLWSGIDGAAQTIRNIAGDLQGRGKRTGAIIRELEALSEAKHKEAECRLARERAERELRDTWEAERRQLEQERQETNSLIDSFSDAELAPWKEQVIANLPPRIASHWKDANPREHEILKGQIALLIKNNGALDHGNGRGS